MANEYPINKQIGLFLYIHRTGIPIPPGYFYVELNIDFFIL